MKSLSLRLGYKLQKGLHCTPKKNPATVQKQRSGSFFFLIIIFIGSQVGKNSHVQLRLTAESSI